MNKTKVNLFIQDNGASTEFTRFLMHRIKSKIYPSKEEISKKKFTIARSFFGDEDFSLMMVTVRSAPLKLYHVKNEFDVRYGQMHDRGVDFLELF